MVRSRSSVPAAGLDANGTVPNGRALKLDIATHVITTLATGFAAPNAVVRDRHRNLFVSASDNQWTGNVRSGCEAQRKRGRAAAGVCSRGTEAGLEANCRIAERQAHNFMHVNLTPRRGRTLPQSVGRFRPGRRCQSRSAQSLKLGGGPVSTTGDHPLPSNRPSH